MVLASDRPDSGVVPLAKDLEMDKYGSYILTFNGAKLQECTPGGKVIHNQIIPPEVIRPLYEIVKKYPEVDILTFDAENLYSGVIVNKYTEWEGIATRVPITLVEDFPSYITWPINCLLITGEPEYLVEMEARLKPMFADKLNIYRSYPYFLEVLPLNIDKAFTLKILLEHMGTSADQMICCGDGYNDISMIQLAGLGVAMENAPDEIKAAADYITKSNDDDGVLYVIDQFMRD